MINSVQTTYHNAESVQHECRKEEQIDENVEKK